MHTYIAAAPERGRYMYDVLYEYYADVIHYTV